MLPLQHCLPEIRKHFDVGAPNDCWVWKYGGRTSKRSKRGQPIPISQYGCIKINKTQMPAHRAVYLALAGEIPEGMIVCHKCDHKRCVNPRHLFLGTYEDNAKDMTAKGRGRQKYKPRVPKDPLGGNYGTQRPNNRGSKNGNCTMTEEEVASLRMDRACGLPLRELSKKYGCSVSSASRLVNFKTHRVHAKTPPKSRPPRPRASVLPS